MSELTRTRQAVRYARAGRGREILREENLEQPHQEAALLRWRIGTPPRSCEDRFASSAERYV
jgi:hypothetical protein